jgi:hypothetical protein
VTNIAAGETTFRQPFSLRHFPGAVQFAGFQKPSGLRQGRLTLGSPHETLMPGWRSSYFQGVSP